MAAPPPAVPPDAAREPLAVDAQPDVERQNPPPPPEERDPFKEKLYLLLDEPKSSWSATYVAIFIVACIMGSTLCYCLETMPTLEGYAATFYQLECGFVAVFTVEYLLRIYATPLPKWRFVIDPMNLIDLIAVFPFYVELIMSTTYLDLRVLRVARLFRVFKATKYSKDFQLIVAALHGSREALVLLAFFMGIATIMFASLLYSLEQGNWNDKMDCYVRPGETVCSPFQSIPHSCYWAVTTITTVGYGDVLPTTELSKATCGICMVCGILVLALPITMIGVSFGGEYTRNTEEAKLHSARMELHNKDDVNEKITNLVEELNFLKENSKVVFQDIGRLLAANIARSENVSDSVALSKITPSYAIFSRAAIVSVDDMESYLRGILAEEGYTPRPPPGDTSAATPPASTPTPL